MCGRYLFSDAEAEDIREIIRDVEDKVGAGSVKIGEIFPTDRAPVLLGQGGLIRPELMSWGFPGHNGKGVIINSRAETAYDKPLFRKSLLTMRCVVPSSGFYEWTHPNGGKRDAGGEDPDQMSLEGVSGLKKIKYLFRVPGEKVLYMAGLYNVFGGERKFVIMTAEANGSVADVHDRMPLVLRKDLLNDWFFDSSRVADLLRESPALYKTAV